MAEPVYWDPLSHRLNEEPADLYRRLRDEEPVYFNDRYGFYALSRFDDVYEARLHPEVYSNSHSVQFERLLDPKIPLNFMNDMDPPAHTNVRKVVAREFTRSRIARLEDFVRTKCVSLMDTIEPDDEFDFVNSVSKPLPFLVICDLLGVDPDYHDQLMAWWDEREALLTSERTRPDLSGSNLIELKIRDLLKDVAEERVKHPRDDLMSYLVASEISELDGSNRPLTLDEAGDYCRAFFVAGSATTTQALSWAVMLLARYPEQRNQLISDPGLIPNAFEEVLRLEPPSPSGGRWLLQDVTLHGRLMPRDSVVMLMTAAASRDDRVYENADDLDVTRKLRHQLAFGTGVHLCIGAALARLEGRVVLEEMLQRFPAWHVDEARSTMRLSSGLRGFFTMPVRAGRREELTSTTPVPGQLGRSRPQ
jgi:cytochrome P450